MDEAEERAAQEHAEQLALEELEQHAASSRPGKRAAAKAAKAAARAANLAEQVDSTPDEVASALEDDAPAVDASTDSAPPAPAPAGRRAGTPSADDSAPRSSSGRRVAPGASGTPLSGTPLSTTPAAYSAHASAPGDPQEAAALSPGSAASGTATSGTATSGSPASGTATSGSPASGAATSGSPASGTATSGTATSGKAAPGKSGPTSGSADTDTDNDSKARTAGGAGQAEAPSRRPRLSGRDLGKKAFGAMAFLFVAGMAVATSLPAQAHLAMNPGSVPLQITLAEGVDQSLTTEASAQSSVSRDSYGVSIPVVSAAVAAVSGSVSSFGNPGLGAIQWPLPGGTPISDGFGNRSSPGGIGSTNHMGMDFDPGSGTPIHAVADGVVTIAKKSDGGGLGCYVEIAHNVNGLSFSSVYGHMQCATVSMSQGESITVTQLVGLVGSTGTSTGAHLHFEIHNASGTPVDPEIWMRANAG